jgi:chromosome segregation and condensation protein ScpB
VLYGTTPQFLHYFGLESLEELPEISEEEETKPAK